MDGCITGFTDDHGNSGTEVWSAPFATLAKQLAPALASRGVLEKHECLYPAAAAGFMDPTHKAIMYWLDRVVVLCWPAMEGVNRC